MLSVTHMLIAEKIYYSMRHELDLPVNREMLRYGSIIPDLYPSMFKMPHDIQGSRDFLTFCIDTLSEKELPRGKKDWDRFSWRLGIIIHFVSDYFCRAHNEKSMKGILAHFMYERKLSGYFKKHIGRLDFSGKFKSGDTCGQKSIFEYIGLEWAKYSRLSKCMHDDMFFSLKVSLGVAVYIANSCALRSGEALMRKSA